MVHFGLLGISILAEIVNFLLFPSSSAGKTSGRIPGKMVLRNWKIFNSYTYIVPTNVTRTVTTNAADLTAATVIPYEGLVGEASFVAVDDATNASAAGLYTGKFLFKLE